MELHEMWQSKKYGLAVLPRQTGKDVAASAEQMQRRLQMPKTTGVYVSLNNPMIRDILWDKTYYCPHCDEYILGMQDQVPSELVDWKATVMEGRFKNKSRLKLQGYFQSGQDKSGVGTSFQDYTFTELALFFREDPIPRIMPILENPMEEKRLMVVSTPRGRRKNPLWALMESLKGNPEFQVIIRTIDDINEIMRNHGLDPVLTQARLEEIRDTYKKRFGNDRMFEQEYYCSFEEMDAAAVYGEALMQLLAEKRNVEFNLDPGHPVYVNFDIGSSGRHSDATAWAAWQVINGQTRIYEVGEGHGKALPEYVDVLREKHWFHRIAWIILPWDGDHHEKAVNTTPADMMRTKFPNVAVLAKSNKVYQIPGRQAADMDIVTDIQQTRMALYNMLIHPIFADWMLECLENYKYAFDAKTGLYSEKPVHDRYSHMMDTLRYIVQAQKELDFFGGSFFDVPGMPGASGSVDYVQDYSGVWAR
jgi:hypothetical protein